MYVLVTYDVETMTSDGQRRLRQVARQCLNYGQRVQNSVFECILNEVQALLLKKELTNIINTETDSIRFYYLGKKWKRKVEYIGIQTSFDMESEIII